MTSDLTDIILHDRLWLTKKLLLHHAYRTFVKDIKFGIFGITDSRDRKPVFIRFILHFQRGGKINVHLPRFSDFYLLQIIAPLKSLNNPITQSGAIIPFSITFGLSGSQTLYLNSVIVLHVNSNI